MSLAVSDPARAPFQRLHEIGKTLMRFERLDDVIPRVFGLVAEDGLVRCQVLITTAAGPEHPYVWRGVQVPPSELCDAVERARGAHEALDLPLAMQVDPEPGFAVYPLIGSEGEVLGTLALQWTYSPDGERLAFGEDVADLLALAMDRDARILRATRSRDDLLATVSHELKNLLAALRANLDLLNRSPALLGDGKEHAHLSRVRRTTDRMGWLVQDLLDVGSVEARRLTVTPQRLDVAAVLAEALEAAAPLAACRSIQLQSQVVGKPPKVLADGARLQQVFANLISNAIKFSSTGGTITVRAEPCAEGVTFSVRDCGIGIGEEDRPHLFDRFWKGRHTIGEGYGLGLFIVQGIIRAHGGRIWVESEFGNGASFFFTIPSADPVVEQAPRSHP